MPGGGVQGAQGCLCVCVLLCVYMHMCLWSYSQSSTAIAWPQLTSGILWQLLSTANHESPSHTFPNQNASRQPIYKTMTREDDVDFSKIILWTNSAVLMAQSHACQPRTYRRTIKPRTLGYTNPISLIDGSKNTRKRKMSSTSSPTLIRRTIITAPSSITKGTRGTRLGRRPSQPNMC